MKELSPDIVLPISSLPGHVGLAFVASPEECLWLTAPERAVASDTVSVCTSDWWTPGLT